MHLVIFEDASWSAFAPLSLTRPVCTLTSGAMTLLRRQLAKLKPARLSLWVRDELAEFTAQRIAWSTGVPTAINAPLDDEPALLVNSAVLSGLPAADLPQDGQHIALAAPNGPIAWALVQRAGLCHRDALGGSDAWRALTTLGRTESQCQFAFQIADVIHANETLIASDFELLRDQFDPCPEAVGFAAVNRDQIRVSQNVSIAPGVVLDASHGPILLAEGASIGANSVIEGPCYIGPGSYIRPLSLIRNGMTIGPVCKIGGEAAESIIQGYTNKIHDGYLGHSFLGECVNFGAGTTTSNVKNTYGPVEMQIGSTHVKTGRMFMGSVVGDHSKTAILTRLMTGSYVGVCSMIATTAPSPKCLPSFMFLTDKGAEPYRMDKAMEVARRVLARRNREWSEIDASVFAYAAGASSSIERP